MVDCIVYNGRIRTMDPLRPNAQALAISGGRFTAVGTDDEILPLQRQMPHCRKIDLRGRLVLPGFHESHIHLLDWALGRQQIDLQAMASLAEVLAAVRTHIEDRVDARVRGGWVLGLGWNESRWPEKRMPLRQDLDRVCADRPILLLRSDLHLAVANSRALTLSGIGADTPDPDQGVIGRDEAGVPNGILQDLAIHLVRKVIPEPTEAEAEQAVLSALPALHALGLTGIQDFRLMDGIEGPLCLRILQRLRERDELGMRVWWLIPDRLFSEVVALGVRTGMGDDMLRIGHLKLFADGSLGAHTAWMMEPYISGGCGIPLKPMAEIARLIRSAEEAGIAVAVHAIGDRANHELIVLFEELERTRPSNVRRTMVRVPHRIEHLQMVRPEDIRRLGRLSVMGSVQPRQATDDIALMAREIGDRGRISYRFRDLIDAGVELAFGSDCPVAHPSPLNGIHAAVTRQREDGSPEAGWYPDQCLGVDEAVWGYTVGPARITGRDRELGSISPGKFADFVVLDRDIYRLEPREILDAQVELTVCGGRIVYDGRRDT
ncbi:MAG: amidohydrolase [Thermodesulfobacteriota bacterium]